MSKKRTPRTGGTLSSNGPILFDETNPPALYWPKEAIELSADIQYQPVVLAYYAAQFAATWDHHVEEVSPGVWEHTFTPKKTSEHLMEE